MPSSLVKGTIMPGLASFQTAAAVDGRESHQTKSTGQFQNPLVIKNLSLKIKTGAHLGKLNDKIEKINLKVIKKSSNIFGIQGGRNTALGTTTIPQSLGQLPVISRGSPVNRPPDSIKMKNPGDGKHQVFYGSGSQNSGSNSALSLNSQGGQASVGGKLRKMPTILPPS